MKILPLINEDEPPSKPSKKQPSVWQRSWTVKVLKSPYAPIIVTFFGLFLAMSCIALFSKAESWWMKEKVVTVPAIGIHTARAAELPDIGDCEQYRPIVQKYFGKVTNEALFVARMEGGCIADRISSPNSDGTRDYCTFQINKEKLAAQSLEVCVRRAFEKYKSGRFGSNNWSDFYAVCPRRVDQRTHKDLPPVPKYPRVISNCN